MIRNLFLFSILFLTACSDDNELDEKELITYLQDEKNGAKQTLNDGEFEVIVTFRPSDFIAKQQMRTQQTSEYDSLRSVYNRYIYFIIDITKNGKDLETVQASGNGDLGSYLSFLSTGFSEKIHLETNQADYSIVDFVYARSYGNASSKFLVAFESLKEDHFRFVIDGYELGFSKISIPFDNDQLKKTPKLKF